MQLGGGSKCQVNINKALLEVLLPTSAMEASALLDEAENIINQREAAKKTVCGVFLVEASPVLSSVACHSEAQADRLASLMVFGMHRCGGTRSWGSRLLNFHLARAASFHTSGMCCKLI